jgi:hypothetical protein
MPKTQKKAKRQLKEIVDTSRKLNPRLGINKQDKRKRSRETHMDNCMKNADCYLKSIMNPFEVKDCRIPTAMGIASATTSLFTREFPALTGVPGRWVGGICIKPNLKSFISKVTDSAAVDSVTWTSSDHPKSSSLDTDAGFYRTVSCGVRIMDVGAMIERGLSMYVGRHPPQNSFLPPSADALTSVTSSPNFELIDLAKLKAEGTNMVWIPMTAYGTSIGTSTMAPNACTWREVVDEVIDTSILVMVVSTRTDVPSDELAIETVLNIEFVPQFTKQFLFAVKTAPGGPDGLAESQAHLAKTSPELHAAAHDTGHTGYIQMAKDAWHATAPARQFLSDAWAELPGLVEMLAPALKAPLPLSRQRGGYHIVTGDDEKQPPSPASSRLSVRSTRF